MSFLAKNFNYSKKPFGQFVDDIVGGRTEYLRAIASGKPMERATRLRDDYPSIASDFQLPLELDFAKEHEHSSPLRMSGPVTMWLHYDVGLPSRTLTLSC